MSLVRGLALALLVLAVPPSVEEATKRGWALCRSERYEEGLSAFQEALRADPAFFSANLGAGVALSGLGRHDDAVRALEEAIRLRPGQAEAHFNLGIALQRAGRLAEAAPALEKAVGLQPGYAAAWSALGWTYARLGAYTKAVDAYRQALRLRTDDAEALRGLGTTLGNLERWTEAVPALERAARLKPEDAGVQYDLARAYAQRQRPRDAAEAYRRAIRLRPDFAAAHFGLGLALVDLGENAQAIAAFREALRIDPGHPAASLNLERALTASGDHAGALQHRRAREARAAEAAPPPGAEDANLFTDVTAASGISFRHENSPTASKYLIETMGGGVALFDYDGDGRLDVFFTNGAALTDPMPAGAEPDKSSPRFANRLYRNKGDGTFEDVTERAGVSGRGYSMGVAVGDYDNDGFEDLYVTSYGPNVLYHNNRDGTFTDVTARAQVAAGGWSASAGFFDYDGDGRLDLFVTRYVDFGFARNPYCGEQRPGYREYCHPRSFAGMTDLLFHNEGDGTFRDASAPAGLDRLVGKSLGVAFADYDGDGRIDVYVANDSVPAFLLHNDGGGRFRDVALPMGVAYNEEGVAVAGMGADLADYDGDGRLDLFVTTLSGEAYSLYRNRGAEGFAYTTRGAGVAQATLPFSGWGTRFFDYDNDGRKDLFVAQGHVLDTVELTSDHLRYQQPPLLLKGDGERFVSVGPAAAAAFRQRWAGRGAAFGDIDDDGDTDVVVANCGQRPYLLRNDVGRRQHWLAIRTVGTRSNRDGLGCRVKTVTSSGLAQYHTVTTAGSYLSASDKRLLVGLGSDDRVRLVEVRWPSGAAQTLTDVKADQILTVREP